MNQWILILGKANKFTGLKREAIQFRCEKSAIVDNSTRKRLYLLEFIYRSDMLELIYTSLFS